MKSNVVPYFFKKIKYSNHYNMAFLNKPYKIGLSLKKLGFYLKGRIRTAIEKKPPHKKLKKLS